MKLESHEKKKYRILIADDEPESAAAIDDILSINLDTIVVTNGNDALRMAREKLPDLILLDINMPGTDGISVCGALRDQEVTKDIPIMMVTGSVDVEQRIKAFMNGADDYLSKPFRSKELVARVTSKLRRLESSEAKTKIIRRGNLELDLARVEARVEGRPLGLSILEFRLLEFFSKKCEEALTRQRIVSAVWNDAVVLDRTVDTHVVSLRKHLKGCDYNVDTVYGMGYIFQPAKNRVK